jgi:DNA-binding response OmpR family regulator
MKKILYVEDNVDTAAAVKIILENVGHDVTTARDGKEGIKISLTGVFDLILLDVMLPDMSGWDIFNNIKGKVKAKYVFLSAIPISSERMNELTKEGVEDYILKPFVKADLIARINKALS